MKEIFLRVEIIDGEVVFWKFGRGTGLTRRVSCRSPKTNQIYKKVIKKDKIFIDMALFLYYISIMKKLVSIKRGLQNY